MFYLLWCVCEVVSLPEPLHCWFGFIIIYFFHSNFGYIRYWRVRATHRTWKMSNYTNDGCTISWAIRVQSSEWWHVAGPHSSRTVPKHGDWCLRYLAPTFCWCWRHDMCAVLAWFVLNAHRRYCDRSASMDFGLHAIGILSRAFKCKICGFWMFWKWSELNWEQNEPPVERWMMMMIGK